MTKNEMRLASEMLGMGADQFANHGCNDFDLPSYMTWEEQVALVTKMAKRNHDEPEELNGRIKRLPSVSDFALMFALADMLEDEAEKL